MKWLALVLLAACGSDPSAPDAGGLATVNVSPPGFGRVISGPTGLRCGKCDLQNTSDCSMPAGKSTCSAMFERGTVVEFSIVDQSVFFGISCAAGGTTFGTKLTVTQDVLVSCTGIEALR